jgi:hypothetical protein
MLALYPVGTTDPSKAPQTAACWSGNGYPDITFDLHAADNDKVRWTGEGSFLVVVIGYGTVDNDGDGYNDADINLAYVVETYKISEQLTTIAWSDFKKAIP